MFDFQQRRRIRGIMYNRITLVILGIIVLIFLHSTWVVYKKRSDSEQMKQVSEGRLADLELRDKELQTKIDDLKTDAGVEAEIRSKFSVSKPDEHMVVVIDGQVPATTTPEADGFWQSLKALFGKKKK